MCGILQFDRDAGQECCDQAAFIIGYVGCCLRAARPSRELPIRKLLGRAASPPVAPTKLVGPVHCCSRVHSATNTIWWVIIGFYLSPHWYCSNVVITIIKDRNNADDPRCCLHTASCWWAGVGTRVRAVSAQSVMMAAGLPAPACWPGRWELNLEVEGKCHQSSVVLTVARHEVQSSSFSAPAFGQRQKTIRLKKWFKPSPSGYQEVKEIGGSGITSHDPHVWRRVYLSQK